MNDATQLLRQVNPSFIQRGHITSQVFRPTPKDEKKLSVYDGDHISPENAWKHYTAQLKYDSVGVMAVVIGECKEQNLPVSSDPELFPEHVIIDFSEFSKNQIEKKAKHLKAVAEKRGWLFEADESTQI